MNISMKEAVKMGARIRGAPAVAAANKVRVRKCDTDGLNKTERAFRDVLEIRKRAGEISDYVTHGVTFILGKDCRYTPEFMVVENDGSITIIEIKGFMRDDALVKFRTAQKQFPWFTWRMIQRRKTGWETIRD